MSPCKWPEAFLVDLDNTLHDYRAASRSARIALANKIEGLVDGLSQDAIITRYESILLRESTRIHSSGQELRMQRIKLLLGTWPQTQCLAPEPFVAVLETALLDAVRPFDGAIEVFHELTKEAPVIVVSEGYGDIQGTIAKKLGIPAHDRNLLATYAHGVRKSDGTAYRLALKWLGFDAQDVVMIGDNWAWDVIAASAAGIWPLWVRGADPLPSQQPRRYLGSVESFRDVPAFMATRWDANPKPVFP